MLLRFKTRAFARSAPTPPRPNVRYRRSEPSFNQSRLILGLGIGGACAGLRASRSVGVDKNGHGPGRARDLDRSRHDEAALGGIRER